MKNRGGFTLIELMLVILIIGVLLGMLLPAINAASVFVKIKDTENRISTLSGYIEQYKQVFGGYPPSNFGSSYYSAYQSLTPSLYTDPVYQLQHHTDFTAYPGFPNDTLPLGGGFLYYMLMGPNQMGWSTADTNVCNPVVAANWQAPSALAKMVYANPIISPYPTNGWTNITKNVTNAPCLHAMYYFEDGFGSTGYLQGTIQYSLRLVRSMTIMGSSTVVPTGTFYSADLDGLYESSAGVFHAFAGPSWQRLWPQCPGPYILLGAGPDRTFGYVIPDQATGIMRPIETTDPANSGVSDDITNFQHN